MRTTALIALSAATVLGLSACGGSEPLTQEQTKAGLLTEDEFPLEGFTAGEITEHEGDSADSTDDASDDALGDFPGAEEFDQECQDALKKLDSLNADFTSSSSVDFTGEGGDSMFGPPEVSLVVASQDEGENPFDSVEDLNTSCEEVTLEENGMTMTVKFEEIEGDAQGTKISMDLMGESVELVVAGREDGGNYTIVTGVGVSDEDIIKVLDAQEEKVAGL